MKLNRMKSLFLLFAMMPSSGFGQSILETAAGVLPELLKGSALKAAPVDMGRLNESAEALKAGNIAKAREILSGFPLESYNPKVYEIRAGLLATAREYKDAVTLLNFVLNDKSLEPEDQATARRLKDYCLEQIDRQGAESSNSCWFCKAHISRSSAYCPVCMQFQHRVEAIKTKNARTAYNFDNEGLLKTVNYYYENRHTGMKLLSIGLAVAAAGAGAYYGVGTTVPVILKDPDKITKSFDFSYEEKVPRKAVFTADAQKGGETISMVATSGVGDLAIGKVGREEAKGDRTTADPVFVYGNDAKVDVNAARIAFGINMSRLFYQSDFHPFLWNEPHIYSANYSSTGQLVSAVDIFSYRRNDTGRYLYSTGLSERDPFNILHSEADLVWSFKYNTDGLLSKVSYSKAGNEVYRRDIEYIDKRIIREVEWSRWDKISKYYYNIESIGNEKQWELNKAREKAKSSQEQANIEAKFDTKLEKARNELGNALKTVQFDRVNEIKYEWSSSKQGAPQLIKATGEGLEVQFLRSSQ